MFDNLFDLSKRPTELITKNSEQNANSSDEPGLSPALLSVYLTVDVIALVLRSRIIYAATKDAIKNKTNRFNSGFAAAVAWIGATIGCTAVAANIEEYFKDPHSNSLSNASSAVDIPLRLLSSYVFLGFIGNVYDRKFNFEEAGFTKGWRYSLNLSSALILASFIPAILTLISSKEDWSIFTPQLLNTILLGTGVTISALSFFVLPKYFECAKEFNTSTLFLRMKDYFLTQENEAQPLLVNNN